MCVIYLLFSYIILDEAAVPPICFFDKNVRESSVGSDSRSRRSSSGLQVRNETGINLGTPRVRLHASKNMYIFVFF